MLNKFTVTARNLHGQNCAALLDMEAFRGITFLTWPVLSTVCTGLSICNHLNEFRFHFGEQVLISQTNFWSVSQMTRSAAKKHHTKLKQNQITKFCESDGHHIDLQLAIFLKYYLYSSPQDLVHSFNIHFHTQWPSRTVTTESTLT